MRYYPLTFIVFFILVIGFFIRIYTAADPSQNPEINRDYLAANHIIKYHELPLIGPYNSLISSIPHSPISFYFLAIFLKVKEDIFFLGFINILLQTLSIFIVYLIAKKLFDEKTGLIAAVLFSLSNAVLSLSSEQWIRNWAFPFINLSFLLLVLAYLKNKSILVLISALTFIFASSIHLSNLLLLPTFLLIIFLILKKRKASLTTHILFMLFFCFCIIFLLVHPQIWNIYLNSNKLLTTSQLYEPSFSFGNYLSSLEKNTDLLISLFFSKHVLGRIPQPNLLLFLILTMIIFLPIYFLYSQKDISKRMYFLLIIGAIMQVLLLLSLMNNKIHYYSFIPVFSLLIIAISEIVNRIFAGNTALNLTKILLVLLLLKVFSFDFAFIREIEKKFDENIFSSPNEMSKYADHVGPIISTIEGQLYSIKNQEHYMDMNFFQIKFYREYPNEEQNWASRDGAIFWNPLEKDFNTQFVTLSTSPADMYLSYSTTNKDDYVFLICRNLNGESLDKGCIELFTKENPKYSNLSPIYSDPLFSVYLSSKQ